ncbi:hypothetical protein BDW68DRAFT_167084 [Aspergillus falconensis]
MPNFGPEFHLLKNRWTPEPLSLGGWGWRSNSISVFSRSMIRGGTRGFSFWISFRFFDILLRRIRVHLRNDRVYSL